MKIEFYKYHGTGNDFIIIDNRSLNLTRENYNLYKKLCDRRLGIGADGIILLQQHDKYDFEMAYFNADGKESSMCGNGGRCIVAFAKLLGIIDKTTQFLAYDGIHKAKFTENDNISLTMKDVSDIMNNEGHALIDTGSPHYVKFVEQLDSMDIIKEGRSIRYSEKFKEAGINVNFVEPHEDVLSVRTYERGVEDETLSCGTGVVASVLGAILKKISNDSTPRKVRTRGGELNVYFKVLDNNNFTDIRLEGPAKISFKGQIDI